MSQLEREAHLALLPTFVQSLAPSPLAPSPPSLVFLIMSSPSSEMGSPVVSPPAESAPVTNGSATAAAVDEDVGDDLFGDDDDAPKPMDGVEQGSTGSASPAAE